MWEDDWSRSRVPRHVLATSSATPVPSHPRSARRPLAAWRPFLTGVAVGLACLLAVIGVAFAQPLGHARLRRVAARQRQGRRRRLRRLPGQPRVSRVRRRPRQAGANSPARPRRWRTTSTRTTRSPSRASSTDCRRPRCSAARATSSSRNGRSTAARSRSTTSSTRSSGRWASRASTSRSSARRSPARSCARSLRGGEARRAARRAGAAVRQRSRSATASTRRARTAHLSEIFKWFDEDFRARRVDAEVHRPLRSRSRGGAGPRRRRVQGRMDRLRLEPERHAARGGERCTCSRR